ncbi:MAG: DUF2269 family protein [Acidimicrobiia bacterium]
MTGLHSWLLFLHVAAAVVWLGGGTAMWMLGHRIRETQDPGALGEFGKTLSFVGLRAFTPSVVVVLGTGIWMVVAGTGEFSQTWIVVAVVAFLIAFFIGAVYLSRQAILLDRLSNEGDLTGARVALRRWLAGYGTVLAILVIALWDMVFKPGI